MTYLWLQTYGGRGDRIVPHAVPADRVASARRLIVGALDDGARQAVGPAGDADLLAREDRGALVLEIADRRGGWSLTMAIAPRRTGRRAWTMLMEVGHSLDIQLAAELDPPQEPWALVLVDPATDPVRLVGAGQWLVLLEAELAVAWLAIVAERRP